jgi:hypothetical protein
MTGSPAAPELPSFCGFAILLWPLLASLAFSFSQSFSQLGHFFVSLLPAWPTLLASLLASLASC